MRKAIASFLAIIICLSLCACSRKDRIDNTPTEFDLSKEAFNRITLAYLSTNEYSQDLTLLLTMDFMDFMYDESDLHLIASKLFIEQVHIEKAVANLCGKSQYSASEKMWCSLVQRYGNYRTAFTNVFFEAYKCSGIVDEINAQLNAAKDLVKTLSNDYSSYEHYHTLKEYFTNAVAFNALCCNPRGDLEQINHNFESYRANARRIFLELNYVFNDSISGLDEYAAAMNR